MKDHTHFLSERQPACWLMMEKLGNIKHNHSTQRIRFSRRNTVLIPLRLLTHIDNEVPKGLHHVHSDGRGVHSMVLRAGDEKRPRGQKREKKKI